MSFTVAAALAIALLVVAPLAAHLLRRRRLRAQEFPPARWVTAVPPAARHARTLEDRGLLLTRVLILLALAVLGATPLVRCSHLAIDRKSGASVAVALVLDDSMSMRAHLANGKTRWTLALEAAEQMLDSMREGDAMAIVLAGRPARLALGATANLRAGRGALSDLRPSDRGTDLAGALDLARSALEKLPHRDKRTAVLSDLAVAELPSPAQPLWAPLALLRQSAADCGVVRAERQGRQVSAEVACNSESGARGRKAEVRVSAERKSLREPAARDPKDERIGRTQRERTTTILVPQSGVQTLALEVDTDTELDLVLSGQDAIPENDSAPVAPRPRALSVALVADPAKAAPITGAVTVLEEALHALSDESTVHPLPTLPEDIGTLERYGALVLDDPVGFTPEARQALGRWLDQGGVAIAFLGPSAAQASLGSTLEPFLSGAVRWEATEVPGVDPSTLGWLGAEAASLVDVAPRGRLRFEGAIPAQSRIVGRWLDGIPMAVEHRIGRGKWVALGLPCSVHNSEFALRPGFLAVLDNALGLASRHNDARTSTAGTPWMFDGGSVVQIVGPRGKLRIRASTEEAGASRRWVAAPDDAGRYRVTIDKRTEQRLVTLDPEEVETMPIRAEATLSRVLAAPTGDRVDVSRTVAWSLVGLLGAELVLRGLGRWRARNARTAGRTVGG